jgi:hypothetical protein
MPSSQPVRCSNSRRRRQECALRIARYPPTPHRLLRAPESWCAELLYYLNGSEYRRSSLTWPVLCFPCRPFQLLDYKHKLTNVVSLFSLNYPARLVTKLLSMMETERSPDKTHANTLQVPLSPAIAALDSDNDADTLALYNQHILPWFQESKYHIYSISLVARIDERGRSVVLQFGSAEEQCDTSKKSIQEGVENICRNNGYHSLLDVVFSVGIPVLL